MRHPSRSKPKAGLAFYARLFPKRMTGALETPPAKTNITQHSTNHSTQSGQANNFGAARLPEPLTNYLQELPSLKGRGVSRQAMSDVLPVTVVEWLIHWGGLHHV